MSYGGKSVRVARNVVLDRRKHSPNWYARLKLPELWLAASFATDLH